MTNTALPFLATDRLDIFQEPAPPLPQTPKILFALGGRRPASDWLSDLTARNKCGVWAVDSGVAACRAADLVPQVMIGDRDSAEESDWAWAVAGGAREVLHPSAKDLTDFQLALDLACGGDVAAQSGSADGNCRYLLLTGCFGGRLDHLFSILETFSHTRNGEGKISCEPRCMLDDKEGVFLLYSGESVRLAFRESPLAVSLLPMTDVCRGIDISGVRWPLRGTVLERRLPWAVSNEARNDEVAVSCGTGTLAVYWCWR